LFETFLKECCEFVCAILIFFFFQKQICFNISIIWFIIWGEFDINVAKVFYDIENWFEVAYIMEYAVNNLFNFLFMFLILSEPSIAVQYWKTIVVFCLIVLVYWFILFWYFYLTSRYVLFLAFVSIIIDECRFDNRGDWS